jgi:serine/threonine protein kinase
MNDHWEHVQQLFDELCELDDASRGAMLDSLCQGDDRLRGEVERLLESHDREQAANAEQRDASIGRRFGAWQTVRLLARGGMGEVWLAQRADGNHEQVAALKILSPYLAVPDSLDRFRRERQLLARLEHPNIARLLDGGMGPDGDPFLVMEYVEGTRLDQYCDAQQMPIAARLRLFVKVCAAVNAAHQHFVVHRDLKPSNILVTPDGEPKLLDFGIAKVIDAEAGLFETATANVFLTPMYASPEVLRGEPATAASDIYSLGVALYELLSGERPYDVSRLSPASLVEAITTKDPRRPSATTSDEPAAELARLRASTPERLKGQLAGDLDSIALKALAKNPQERYASVAQLADDIERHLEGQPVTAVPLSRWYVSRKFVRRNRLAVSAAAVLLISLTAGLAGTLWQAQRARRERVNADHRFNEARQLANYLVFDLYDSIVKIPGTLPVQAEMAGRALQYLDRLEAVKSSDPGLRVELVQGYLKLGNVYARRVGVGDRLGDVQKAIAIDRKALAIIQPMVLENPQDLAGRRALASVRGQLGYALSLAGQYKDAFDQLRQSAEASEQIAASRPRDPASLRDAGTAWYAYGKQLSEQGGYVGFEAERPLSYLQKSVAELEASWRLEAGNDETIQLLASTYESIGRIESLPNPARGVEAYTTALEWLTRLPEEKRNTADVRQLQAMMRTHIGWDQGQLGDFKGAIANLESARITLDQQAAADPQNAGAAFRQVDLYRSLGLIHGYAGHKKDSLDYLRKAVDILDGLVKRDPTNVPYTAVRAELQGRVADLLMEAGAKSEAFPYAEASSAYFRKIAESPGANTQQLMEAIKVTAETEVESLRDYPAALRFALRADQLASGKNPAICGFLAEAYALNGHYSKAVVAAQRGIAATPPTRPGRKPSRLLQWLEDEKREYQQKATTKVAKR